MKNILLLAHDDAGQEARFQCALDLTRALGGHLTCVDVTQPPVVMAEYYGGIGGSTVLYDEAAQETANASRLKARLAKEDVSWDWIDATDSITHCLRNLAQIADVVVVSLRQHAAALPETGAIAASVWAGTRGLVLGVPEDCDRFDVLGAAVIAWDGSPPVLATLRAAVPLLTLASSVLLLTVEDGSDGIAAEDAATYLSRHGIHATIQRVHDGLIAADEHIRDVCDDAHAAYCVMGAYGHSRITEAIFGGVTRRMLAKSDVPLVMGH